MQLAAKIRKDFLKVDRFWRTFLTNHSKYNPIPLDQLAPIASPAPVRVDTNTYLKDNRNVPVHHKNDIGVQTLEIKNVKNNSESLASDIAYQELNGTKVDLSIEEVKIDSYEVYEVCEVYDNDNIQYRESPIDSEGDELNECSEDSKTITCDDKVDNCMKRRSGRKYPKNRNIHGSDPIKGEERLFKCMESECKQGECHIS